jgi:hypothetical protein
MRVRRVSETFKLKKSDIKKSDILVPLFIYTCPLCYKRILSHTVNKTLAYAKMHIERVHGLKVEVAEE